MSKAVDFGSMLNVQYRVRANGMRRRRRWWGLFGGGRGSLGDGKVNGWGI